MNFFKGCTGLGMFTEEFNCNVCHYGTEVFDYDNLFSDQRVGPKGFCYFHIFELGINMSFDSFDF